MKLKIISPFSFSGKDYETSMGVIEEKNPDCWRFAAQNGFAELTKEETTTKKAVEKKKIPKAKKSIKRKAKK